MIKASVYRGQTVRVVPQQESRKYPRRRVCRARSDIHNKGTSTKSPPKERPVGLHQPSTVVVAEAGPLPPVPPSVPGGEKRVEKPKPRRLSLTDIHHTDRQSIWTDSAATNQVRRTVREEIHKPVAKPGEIQAKRVAAKGVCNADVETAFRHKSNDLHSQQVAGPPRSDHRRAATDIHMYGHGQEENNVRHEAEGRVVSRRKGLSEKSARPREQNVMRLSDVSTPGLDMTEKPNHEDLPISARKVKTDLHGEKRPKQYVPDPRKKPAVDILPGVDKPAEFPFSCNTVVKAIDPPSKVPAENRLTVDTKPLHNRVMSDIHKGVTSLENCSGRRMRSPTKASLDQGAGVIVRTEAAPIQHVNTARPQTASHCRRRSDIHASQQSQSFNIFSHEC